MMIIRIKNPLILIITLFFGSLISNVRSSKRNDDVFCECKRKEIRCKGILGFDTLKKDFSKAKRNCDATKLHISNSHLDALPDELIFGSNITEIKIERTYLPFLAAPIGNENPFIGGTLLEKFSVETVIYPYNWNWKILNVCKNMEELRITNSDMIYIGPSFKKLKLPNLNHLSIKDSRVKWIHDKAFASFKKLVFINLKNNYLKNFQRSLLPDPALYLTVFNFRSSSSGIGCRISIGNNLLEYLEEDFFNNMPLLTYVNLENNNLVTVSEFKNREFFVNIAGNPLICDCSIAWLNRVKNQTDSYRLHCFDPMDNGKRILVKRIHWKDRNC